MAIKQRNKEDLKKEKEKRLEKKYNLVDQIDFKGSDKMLNYMRYCERMYLEGKPVINDESWDFLVKKYNYQESISEMTAIGGRRWRKMGSPLISIRKALSLEDTEKFLDKYKGEKFIVQPKLDGVTFCAFYECRYPGEFELKEIGTRGDGLNSLIFYPEAIDRKKQNIYGLPERIKIDLSDLDQVTYINNEGKRIFELRGEIVVRKSDYPNSVHRTISSGIANRKNETDKVNYKLALENNIYSLEECLKFNWPKKRNGDFLYKRCYLIEGNDSEYYTESVEGKSDFFKRTIKDNIYFITFSGTKKKTVSSYYNGESYEITRFRTYPFKTNNLILSEDILNIEKREYKANEIAEIIKNFYGIEDNEGYKINLDKRFKTKCVYPLDGIVIKTANDSHELKNVEPKAKAGKIVVPHHPENVLAVKLKSIPNITKILKINKTETNLGNITYSADVEPFRAEDGKIVKKLNLHNQDWLNLTENRYIKEGAEILVYQAMDIISVPEPLDRLTEEEINKIKERQKGEL